jgi:hydroxypyruvate reductase
MKTAAQPKLPASNAANSEPDVDRLLRDMFDAAIAAAQPSLRVPKFPPQRPRGRTIVIDAGKAPAAMARAVEDHWTGRLEGSQ